MGLDDIRIPADASDKQTTDARSAKPPVEFTVSRGVSSNVISIVDRQAPANRAATVGYRVYFLPEAFLPSTDGIGGVRRLAGKNVADLVADVAAPGRGTTLVVRDTIYYQQAGHYYCVAVNRSGVEAPPEHVVSTDSIDSSGIATGNGVNGGGGGGGGIPIGGLTSINTDVTPDQILYGGANITITDDGIGGHTIAATGGGGFTMENSSTVVDGIAVVFTFSTAVAANDEIFSDGRLMDEAIGDYTRLGATVTFAFAPISTAKRVF